MTIRRFILAQIGKKQGNLIKCIEPIDRKEDERLCRQIVAEFGFVPAPVLLHSPARDLFAGVWMMLREILLVGHVPRHFKETISLVVSDRNRCPFCVDSHVMALNGLGLPDVVDTISRNKVREVEDGDLARLVAWAGADLAAAPDQPQLPFRPDEAPEIIGTLVLFHYLNRVVNVFLEDTSLPGPTGLSVWRKLLQRAGGQVFKALLDVEFQKGKSLAFLPDANLPEDLNWAAPSPNVAGAVARFDRAADCAVRSALSEDARHLITESLRELGGKQLEPGRRWLDEATRFQGLGGLNLGLTQLALLSALTSYQIIPRDLENVRLLGASDQQLVATVAWASFKMAKQIGNRITEFQ